MKRINLKLSAIFVILHLSYHISTAQQPNLDSLYAVWQDESQTDSARGLAYANYIWSGFLHSDPDSAFILSENLLSYGIASSDLLIQADAYSLLGAAQYRRGNFVDALKQYQKSLDLDIDLEHESGQARTLKDIGSTYGELGDRAKQLQY